MEDRLTELETKVTYQDQIIEDLNNVVIELRKKVDSLEGIVKRVVEAEDDPELKDASLETPPPHY